MSSLDHSGLIPNLKAIRRVVTGHDAEGRAIILDDRPANQTLALGVPNHGVTDLWKTLSSPASNEGNLDPCAGPVRLEPPAQGTVFRVVEFPPDQEYLDKFDHKAAFASMGEAAAASLTNRSGILMHRTASIDYAIVLEGEIWAVLDKDETCLKAGDVLIQRGTNHGWSNRTERPSLVAFVMVGAAPLTT